MSPLDEDAFRASVYSQNSDYEDAEKPKENLFKKFRDRKALEMEEKKKKEAMERALML